MKILSPGATVDSLTVVSLIGKGGFGEVYLVCDVSGGRFALKTLNARAGTEISGFIRVRDQLKSIDGLARIHSAGKLPDGRIYYLMECADNLGTENEYIPDTLANRLARNGAMETGQLLGIVDDILAVCEKIHAAGYIHRDLKPENIIFVNGKTKIADFGLTAPFGDGEADMGTSAYMPREEVFGKVKGGFQPGMDLYAVGKLLYSAYHLRAAEEYPAPGENIDPATYRIVRKIYLKALHETPAFRFRDAKEFRAEIRRAQIALTRRRAAWRKSPLLWSAAILVLILFAVFFSVSPTPEKKSPVAAPEPTDTPWEEPLFTDEEDSRIFKLVTQTSGHGMDEYGKLCGTVYRLQSELNSPDRRDGAIIRRELAAAQEEMKKFAATDRGNIITASADLIAEKIAKNPAKYRRRKQQLIDAIRNYRKNQML